MADLLIFLNLDCLIFFDLTFFGEWLLVMATKLSTFYFQRYSKLFYGSGIVIVLKETRAL